MFHTTACEGLEFGIPVLIETVNFVLRFWHIGASENGTPIPLRHLSRFYPNCNTHTAFEPPLFRHGSSPKMDYGLKHFQRVNIRMYVECNL